MAVDPGSIKSIPTPYIDTAADAAPPAPEEKPDSTPAFQGPGKKMDEGAWSKQNFQMNLGGPRTSQAHSSDEVAYVPSEIKTQVTVDKNTSLSGLAKQYGVSENEIIRANPGKEAALLNAQSDPNKAGVNHTMLGQKLNIPNPEGYGDRTLHVFTHLQFRSTGDAELHEMKDTAGRIAEPNTVTHEDGPAAHWTPQQRLNFARARTEMQQEGKPLSEVLGEKALPEATSHLLGDLAASGLGAEAAAGPLGLAIGAAGELAMGSAAKIIPGNSDYNMAKDVETLRQLVASNGPRALDVNNLLQDGRFNGKIANGAGDPKPYITALIVLYEATFGDAPNPGSQSSSRIQA